jgi:hypothetical protein
MYTTPMPIIGATRDSLRAVNAELAVELADPFNGRWFPVKTAPPRKPEYADILDPIERRRIADRDRKRAAAATPRTLPASPPRPPKPPRPATPAAPALPPKPLRPARIRR